MQEAAEEEGDKRPLTKSQIRAIRDEQRRQCIDMEASRKANRQRAQREEMKQIRTITLEAERAEDKAARAREARLEQRQELAP